VSSGSSTFFCPLTLEVDRPPVRFLLYKKLGLCVLYLELIGTAEPFGTALAGIRIRSSTIGKNSNVECGPNLANTVFVEKVDKF
jgi:hypothetical protein